MIRKMLSLSFILTFLVICVLGCSPAATLEYSAEGLSRYKSTSSESRVYVSGKKLRFDYKVINENMSQIIRQDKGIVWILMPDRKRYIEKKLSAQHLIGKINKIPGEINREEIGSEIINGISCDKYKIIYKPDKQSEEMTAYQWISEDKILIKSEAVDGSWSHEYKNIKLEDQPDSLFELPADYKKFAINF